MSTNDRTLETTHDTGHDTKDGRALLVIRTSHNPNRKAFISRVKRITKTDFGYQEKFSFQEAEPVPAKPTPVARYSEKALKEAHAAYIAEHNLDDPATLDALIEWAKGA